MLATQRRSRWHSCAVSSLLAVSITMAIRCWTPSAAVPPRALRRSKLGRQWVGIDISAEGRWSWSQQPDARRTWPVLPRRAPRRTFPRRTDLGKLQTYNGAANKRKLYGEQEGHCAGCNTHFEARHLEVDHIIARGKGGTDHIENLQLLCGSCNRIKGDRGMEYLRAKLQL